MCNRDYVAEWLRRQLKALVRKSEGSNPSVIMIFSFSNTSKLIAIH